MQITNAYSTAISNTLRTAVAVTENDTTASTRTASPATLRETPLINEVVSEPPNNIPASLDDAALLRQEVNELLQQFSEWVRVTTESKRMELLYNLLLKDNHETSDLFGKIMDIARRIMRGEDVSPEEMRFLADQNPQLLFVVIIMRDDTTDSDGKERRRDRERRTKDRRSLARRRGYNSRSHSPSDIRDLGRVSYPIPRELTKQVNPLFSVKTLKKSYETAVKGKTLSLSINTIITNPHDIAT